MTNQTTAIEVTGIAKSYGDQPVLRGLDLTVPTGTVYALLGPNGAGKTTMVRILSTLIAADEGEARVAGFDVRTEPDGVRRSIGVTGQFSAIDELLTGRENLRLMADLAHLPAREAADRVDELLARFGLTDAADRRAATYSGGMKRRLDLAMTLVSRPRLIFLDEPTTGLDPRSRRDLWQIVRELLADGVTIFLTTQYLEEADQLAHTVGLLDDGRLVATGTPAELKAQAGGETLDDVFLALTGHAATDRHTTRPTRRRRSDEHHDLRRPRLGHDAAAQPQAPGPLPVADPDDHRDAGGLPAAVRLRLRRHHGCRASRRRRQRRPSGRLPALHHAGDPGDDRGVGGEQHRDPGREGRDRGDHRPVPDDAHRAVGAADRARAGRDGADGARACSWSSSIALAARLPGWRVGGRVGRRRRHARC